MMMREVASPDRQWVETHRVCFEQQPLREMVKGHGLEITGTWLRLFARVHSSAPGQNLLEIALDVHARCVRLLREALADHAEPLRVDIDAFDFTGHLRPETHHTPELEASARIVADHGGLPDHEQLRVTLERAERFLREHGVHDRVWEEKRPALVAKD